MENANLNPDERRAVLKQFNHRINNDLQALLAFIKLKQRFGVDNAEILNFSSVSIASISAIQNQMYYADDESEISAGEFLNEFKKVLDDNYSRSNVEFSYNIKSDFSMHPKTIFHMMFLLNEMVSLTLSTGECTKIGFELEKNENDCILTYSDTGIKETLSGSDMRKLLFEQSLKQIRGILLSDNPVISIRFPADEN
ncbi:histidine kinase dimerization/phosphoacceptor domain -containing protein [Methanobrevibacter sp.]|uniref:histidine kinase dimerization/phosphoacceptor domain -containing protein n=1 Tax=Methanobrevibacter sp. TaxID=66852 RepID=UPI0038900D2F